VLARYFDRGPAVRRLAHHLQAVPLEQGAHALTQHDMIVGQYYA